MSKIINEWFFDRIYDDQIMDLIHKGLKKRISKWTNDSYLQLRRHLHRHPTQKSAAFMEESKTEAVVCGHKVCFLTALLCDEGPLGGFHFIIYVGPEEVIAKRRDETRARFAEHFRHSGVDGFLIEEDMRRNPHN